MALLVSLLFADIAFLLLQAQEYSHVADYDYINNTYVIPEDARAYTGVLPVEGFHPLGFGIDYIERARYQSDRF